MGHLFKIDRGYVIIFKIRQAFELQKFEAEAVASEAI